MSTHETAPGPKQFGQISFGLVSGLVMVTLCILVAGKELEFLSDPVTKRGVGLTIGLMLIMAGNYLPKFVLPLSDRAYRVPALLSAERFSGWVLVLTGLVYAIVLIIAPIDDALFRASLVGLAGFGLVVINWVRIFASPAVRDLDIRETATRLSPARMATLSILNAILWVLAMFVTDAIWGDQAAQWLAIIFVIVNGVFAVGLSSRLLSNPSRT